MEYGEVLFFVLGVRHYGALEEVFVLKKATHTYPKAFMFSFLRYKRYSIKQHVSIGKSVF